MNIQTSKKYIELNYKNMIYKKINHLMTLMINKVEYSVNIVSFANESTDRNSSKDANVI